MRFTLEHRQWYGLEMTGDEFHDTLWEPRYRHFSPIKVLGVTPHGRGNRQFTLGFYHSNYPSGVQGNRCFYPD
jgi:hypothetical protein